MRTLLPLLLVTACTPGTDATIADDTDAAPLAWCEGTVTQTWNPLVDTNLDLFPDPVWTTPDAAMPTGQRLDLEGAPWLEEMPTGAVALVEPLGQLSGFGRLGAIVLRFDGALADVPTTAEASLTDPGLVLAELTDAGPVRVPYRAKLGLTGSQLVVQPLQILSPGARHVVVLTTAHTAADGGCVAPSSTFRRLMSGADVDPRIAAVKPAFDDALTALGLAPTDVSAMTVFTTHDDVARGFLAAADDIATRTYAWDTAPTCDDGDPIRTCHGTFVAQDYRTDKGGVFGGAPQASWTLPVDLWLPASATGPVPVVMFGHGMNGDRGNGLTYARDLVPQGFAVVSTDALFHGDHPTTAGLSTLGGLPFLGLDLDAGIVSIEQIRGSFQQTGLDRAQLARLLQQVPDVDGDEVADLDATRFGYIGVSLGGLLGPSFLVAHPDVGAAVLQVAGGHLVVFVTETGITQQIHPLLVGLVGDEDGLDRFLAVTQTGIDPADPAVLADHLTGRHAIATPADVLLQCAQHDEVVPPATGEMLARGLEAPRLLPGAWAVDAVTDGPPRTDPVVAYQQFGQVTDGDHLVDADHNGTPRSPEALGQALHFLTSWEASGTAEVVAPVSP